MFRNPNGDERIKVELARSSYEEKDGQIRRLAAFRADHQQTSTIALQQVLHSAIANQNVFAALMVAVEVCSLGQLTDVLFEVGGQYRRNL